MEKWNRCELNNSANFGPDYSEFKDVLSYFYRGAKVRVTEYLTVISSTILDRSNENLRPPLPPPISMMRKWRVFLCARIHDWFWGEGGGLIFHFKMSKIDLGQFKWKLKTNPPPSHFNVGKMAAFCFARKFMIDFGGMGGGGGLIFHFNLSKIDLGQFKWKIKTTIPPPPPPPHFNDGKMACFALRVSSWLILGEWGV